LAEEVRKYHIPDFSNWKNHDAFERAFARLEKTCARASANETERGSVSRSTSDLQTGQFIPNTFCLAKLLRVADPRSDW